jgi:hypothetical protein
MPDRSRDWLNQVKEIWNRQRISKSDDMSMLAAQQAAEKR